MSDKSPSHSLTWPKSPYLGQVVFRQLKQSSLKTGIWVTCLPCCPEASKQFTEIRTFKAENNRQRVESNIKYLDSNGVHMDDDSLSAGPSEHLCSCGHTWHISACAPTNGFENLVCRCGDIIASSHDGSLSASLSSPRERFGSIRKL